MQIRHHVVAQTPDPEAQPFASTAASNTPSPASSQNQHSTAPTARSRRPSKKPNASTAYDLNVRSVVLGDRIIKPLYPSLYRFEILGPEPVERLFVCARCYRYTLDAGKHLGHGRFCEYADSIPGRVIYAKGRYSIHEFDGEESRLFAQNLSLFSKLFIETKSVCFDVTNFLYYLLVDAYPQSYDSTSVNTSEASKPQIVAFFSKEKVSWDNNNLACILVFPPWQKRGLGQLLVGVSYELSMRNGKFGGPERPLSVPGAHSYNLYWGQAISRYLLSRSANRRLSIAEVSEATYILPEDVVWALTLMDVLILSPDAPNDLFVREDNGTGLAIISDALDIKAKKPTRGGSQDKGPGTIVGKKLLKKAEGCILVDRSAVQKWLNQSVGGDVLGTELKVDRDAFVEGAAWPGMDSRDDEEQENSEEEEELEH